MQLSEYDLHCEFDIDLHAAKYPHYLEVIIDNVGKVHYAVPSHQEKLISMVCQKLCVSRDELNNMCPPEYYFDFMTWLCMQINAIAVYTEGYVAPSFNDVQLKTLEQLWCRGIYEGDLPECCEEFGI